MSTQNTSKNHKEGHRSRLRKRYLENGVDALAEHEILEFILFYSIPRTDTKPIAYKLLDTFGSLRNVLSASHEALVSAGLTSACAAHIKIVFDIHKWIANSGLHGKEVSGYNEIGKIFLEELGSDCNERVVMLLFDSKDRIIAMKELCKGSFSSTKIDTREISKNCLALNAAKIAVAHNHPGGKNEISLSDHMTTQTINSLCSMLDVELIEHYIISGNSFYGINKQREYYREAEKQVYYTNHMNE